jgi:quinoprotein glucose dehydrogenase
MPPAYYRFNVVLTVVWAVFLVALSAHSGNKGPGQFRQGEWPSYGADTANSKYSPLDQIQKDNVKGLQIAWRWRSVENAILKDHPALWTMINEATPLMIDGRLYTSTSLSQVAAIDARTGQTLWVYDPESYKQGSPPNFGFVHRGVAYWADGETQRIFIGTGDAQLIALDAKTGQPVPEFGANGRIDLTQGLGRPVAHEFYGVTSPPVICRNVVIVGSSILDNPRVKAMPPGDVRGFDVRTGQQRWIFHAVPQGDEPGVDTWENDSWKSTGNTNVWTVMSCDEPLGYVYLPFSAPSNDYYGGQRPGHNLFAESLVALQAETGVRVWHFQMVHHGVWDYDLPAAPNLVDIMVEGQRIRAVAQVTKQGFCYVFDRVTGAPVWPIEERPVPQSTIPGEKTSPTQPFPTKPLPFEQQGITPNDVIDFTPALQQEALRMLHQYAYGPLFTPPTAQGTITVPGVLGGANWSGAAVHPETGMLYVPSFTLPSLLSVRQAAASDSPYPYVGAVTFGLGGPQGLPLVKPPYGRITAINLNTGAHRWMRPVGEGPRAHAALRHLQLPPLGWPRRSFPLLTKSLLLVAQQGILPGLDPSPHRPAGRLQLENHAAVLYAFDPDNGVLIAQIALPGNASGAPMTYMVDGKQFIVLPIGGAGQPAELVALRLP